VSKHDGVTICFWEGGRGLEYFDPELVDAFV